MTILMRMEIPNYLDSDLMVFGMLEWGCFNVSNA